MKPLESANCATAMVSKLRDERGITLVVVLSIMVVLLSIIGAGVLFSGINLKITSNYQGGTKAFYAADMGLQHGVTLVNATGLALPAFTSTGLPTGLGYRSGIDPSNCTPQASPPPTTAPLPGSALTSGVDTTYSSGSSSPGSTSYRYQLNVVGSYSATGACAAGNAARVVQAQGVYGPVPVR